MDAAAGEDLQPVGAGHQGAVLHGDVDGVHHGHNQGEVEGVHGNLAEQVALKPQLVELPGEGILAEIEEPSTR